MLPRQRGGGIVSSSLGVVGGGVALNAAAGSAQPRTVNDCKGNNAAAEFSISQVNNDNPDNDLRDGRNRAARNIASGNNGGVTDTMIEQG